MRFRCTGISGGPFVRTRHVATLVLASLVFLPACSSLSTPPGGLGVPHLEDRSSDRRPAWIDSLGHWQSQHPDREYFVGITSKEPDMESGRTDAYENALQSIAERVGSHARSLYQEVSSRNMGTGNNGMDMSVRRDVRSMVTNSARARIGGVRIEDYFWQKFWEKDQEGASPYSFYRYYSLVSLRKDRYEQLIRHALKGARDKSSDPGMKALFDKMISQEGSGRP